MSNETVVEMRKLELRLAKDMLATLRAGELKMLDEKLVNHVEFAERRLERARLDSNAND